MRSLALLLCLVGCDPTPHTPRPLPEGEVSMRTWTPPPGTAPGLVHALNSAMYVGREAPRRGHAVEGPGGALVVVAPEAVLDGVDALVQQAASQPAQPARNVELSYWLVVGRPDAGGEGAAPELGEVADALDTLAATDGVSGFELLARRRLRTLDGASGQLKGQQLLVEQEATIEPGGEAVIAQLRIEAWFEARQLELSTRMLLVPGQTVVLSQLGSGGAEIAYLLVRAAVVPAA